ncbi:hypothetical protein MPSEU_000127500 [Mayamaea pseudoterrestris]|nr:hypothetical protein MPSEU_000127500 [Mayamaea pseudoterrestris]
MHNDYRRAFPWLTIVLAILQAMLIHASESRADETRSARRARSIGTAQTTVYNSYTIYNTRGWTTFDFSETSVIRSSLDLGYKAFVLQEFNDFFHGGSTINQRRLALAGQPLQRVEYRGSTELIEDLIAIYLMLDVTCPVGVNATCQTVYASFALQAQAADEATNADAMAEFVAESLTYQTNENLESKLKYYLMQVGFDSTIQVFIAMETPLPAEAAVLTNVPTPLSPHGLTTSPVYLEIDNSQDITMQPDYQPTLAVSVPIQQSYVQPSSVAPTAAAQNSFDAYSPPTATIQPVTNALASIRPDVPSQAPAATLVTKDQVSVSSRGSNNDDATNTTNATATEPLHATAHSLEETTSNSSAASTKHGLAINLAIMLAALCLSLQAYR